MPDEPRDPFARTTPRPWHLREDGGEGDVVGSDGSSAFWFDAAVFEGHRRDIALVIRAVNEYEALLDLEAAVLKDREHYFQDDDVEAAIARLSAVREASR